MYRSFLTHEEEIEVWRSGDINRVVEDIMPLAYRIIRSIAKGDRYLEDEFKSYVGEVIAKAVKQFKPGQYRFSTFALSHLALNLYRLRDNLYKTNTAMLSGDMIDCVAHEKSHVVRFDNCEIANHILDAVCDERTRAIVIARYTGYTLKEVGAMFKVSKQRIGEIERSFLNDARTYLQKRFAA